MNTQAAARLTSQLAAVKEGAAFGPALVSALLQTWAADGAVVWLPSAPAGSSQSAEVFAGGSLCSGRAPDLAILSGTETVQAWFVDRGALSCVMTTRAPLVRTIAVAWRRPIGADLEAIRIELEFVAAQVCALLELRRAEGRLELVRAALRDAENQIARTRRARAVGEMALGIAHDFNNCLTTILGFTELALGPLSASDPYFTDLATIRMAALDAAALVRRLQNIGRRTQAAEEREIVDLRDVVQVMPEMAKPRWSRRAQVDGLTFDLVVDAQPAPPVFVSAGEIRELLLNLVFNAVDAMPSGGRITISTGTADGSAQIAVRDEGIGMSEETQANLFQPFFTTKGERGCGLGLSVCRSIAQRYGGVLSVQSALGRGTTFILTLPPAPAELLAPRGSEPVVQQSVAVESSAEAGRSVLLIDDQDVVRDSVGEMLRALGHDVVTAQSGNEALALVKDRSVDIVLTDFGMPGMNGVEVARRFQSASPNTPVVLLTGWGLDSDAAPPTNVSSVLSKPVTMSALRNALAACPPKPQLENRRAKCS